MMQKEETVMREVLDQIWPLVDQLNAKSRQVLIAHLQQLEAGPVESLYGRFRNPVVAEADLSYEAIEAVIHEHSWEEEIDEL